MSQQDKPREFWIRGQTTYASKPLNKSHLESIHVIEYSAYQDLKQNSVRIEIVKDLLTKVLNNHTQDMEGYSYFGSNPGVPEDEYNEIADELIAELKTWQKMKDTE